ncbi:hypothetical protein SprV_0100116700 [Sparganum proliferum]
MTGAPSLSLPPIPSHSSQRNVSSYRSLPRYIGTPSAPPCSCPQRCTPHRFTSWHVGIASSPRQVTQLLVPLCAQRGNIGEPRGTHGVGSDRLDKNVTRPLERSISRDRISY